MANRILSYMMPSNSQNVLPLDTLEEKVDDKSSPRVSRSPRSPTSRDANRGQFTTSSSGVQRTESGSPAEADKSSSASDDGTTTDGQHQHGKSTPKEKRPSMGKHKTSMQRLSRRAKVYMKAPRIVFRGHQQPILSVSVVPAPDNADTYIISGSEDKLVKIWSLARGELLATLEGHVQRVSGVTGFKAEGFPTLAISASWDDTVRIWNLDARHASNVELITAGIPGIHVTNVISPRDDSNNITPRSTDHISKEHEHNHSNHHNSSSSTNTNSANSNNNNSNNNHHNNSKHDITKQEPAKHDHHLPFKLFGAHDHNGSHHNDHSATGHHSHSHHHHSHHRKLLDKSAIESASVVLRGHKNRVYCVTTLLDGPGGYPIAASGSADNTIRTWSLPKGVPLQVLENTDVFTWNLCIAAWRVLHKSNRAFSGPVVVTGCKNSTVCVWQLEPDFSDGLLVIRGHTSAVQSLSLFNFEGEPMIVTVCRDKDLRVWSMLTGELMKVMKGHTSIISSVSAYNIGKKHGGVIIVSSSVSGSIRGWKYTTGEVLRIFNGHTDEVNVITSFKTPEPEKDELVIVSGSRDCTLRTWLLADEKSLRVLSHIDDEADRSKVRVRAVEVYPVNDDSMIITGADDGKLRNWIVSRAHDDDTILSDPAYTVAAHTAPIIAMGLYIPVYVPPPGVMLRSNAMTRYKVYPNYLYEPLVITASRTGEIRISSLDTGEAVCDSWQAHNCVLTAICVSGGFRAVSNNNAAAAGATGAPHPAGTTAAAVAAATAAAAAAGTTAASTTIAGATSGAAGNSSTKILSPGSSAAMTAATVDNRNPHIDPFLITGGEDNLVKVWSLVDLTCMHVLESHIFDVTSVGVYLQKPIYKVEKKSQDKAAQAKSFRVVRRSFGAVEDSATFRLPEPIIVSGSMDNTVHLWSFGTGKIIAALTEAPVHITAVTTIDLKNGPVVAAGDGNGVVRLWSLKPPFSLLNTLNGHMDEVRALHAYDSEGINPILVTGSLDSTLRVWDLQNMQEIRTVEGHKSDITCLRVFSPGGSDTSVASASTDCTVRVMFNFLGNLANIDVVGQLFKFDLEGKNNHILHGTSQHTVWPRIAQMAAREGADRFFGLYYQLFGKALRENRPDFLAEFLPQSQIGLLKSNSEMEDDDPHNNRGSLLCQAIKLMDSSAVKVIVDCWVEYFNTPQDPENGPIYDPSFGQISVSDMLLLAEVYPKEFEKLICNIRMLPAKNNEIEENARFLYEDSDHRLKMRTYKAADIVPAGTDSSIYNSSFVSPPNYSTASRGPGSPANPSSNNIQTIRQAAKAAVVAAEAAAGAAAEAVDSATGVATDAALKAMVAIDPKSRLTRKGTSTGTHRRGNRGGGLRGSLFGYKPTASRRMSIASLNDIGEGRAPAKRHQTFFFLPLQDAVQMEMMRAYCNTCIELDSVEIFKSEAGSRALSFAWRAYGFRVHMSSMILYCAYIAIACTSTLTFTSIKVERPLLSLALIIVQLIFDVFFIQREVRQFFANVRDYGSDVWNYIDLVVIFGGLSANILRIYYWDDNLYTRVLLSITSIFAWFGILYFLRAFESTGPLVSMILQISKDITYLLLCVVIVLVGFSQAFWLVSDEDKSLPFSQFRRSLLFSYVWLLGEYDPTAFKGAELEGFGILLSTIYMLICSILLLNLLIALMGDSYVTVKAKGLAQWKLEQALIITEMEGSLSEADKNCSAVVYFRRNTDDVNAATEGRLNSGWNSGAGNTTAGGATQYAAAADGKTGIRAGAVAGVERMGGLTDSSGPAATTKKNVKLEDTVKELQTNAAKMMKEQNDLATMVRETSHRMEVAIHQLQMGITNISKQVGVTEKGSLLTTGAAGAAGLSSYNVASFDSASGTSSAAEGEDDDLEVEYGKVVKFDLSTDIEGSLSAAVADRSVT